MSRSRATSALIIAGRLALLATAAAAAAFAFASRSPSVGRGAGAVRAAPAEAPRRFTCPMHADVTAAAPGQQCPICRMALEEQHAPSQSNDGAEQIVATVGRRTVTAELRAPAWVGARGDVTAAFHNDELAAAAGESGALFFAAARPEAGIAVRATGEPPVAWDGAMSMVRYRVGGGRGPAEGSIGWIVLPARPRARIVVPASALLQGDDGPHVLVADRDGRASGRPGPGRFKPRPVEIGRIAAGMAAVRSGVTEGETIAVAGVWALEAERRLTARARAAEARP